MQHNNSWKAYTDKQLAYQFIDNDKQIMLININSIMARDNFEYMQKQGLKDLYRQIGFYYRDILKQDMPADTLQAIRQLPSLSEVFAHMLKEMKKEASSTLIIDLRNNSGGWTPIVLPTLYQLFGDHFLQTDMDIEFYRIISPLYMQKLQTNLQDFNQAYETDYAYGDYTFSTDEADTTDIEQRRTDFIENCMSSVPEELRKQQGKALYTPEHIYHYQRTYLQCSFPLHFLSVENGGYPCRNTQRTSPQYLHGTNLISATLYRYARLYLQLHTNMLSGQRPVCPHTLSRLDTHLSRLPKI